MSAHQRLDSPDPVSIDTSIVLQVSGRRQSHSQPQHHQQDQLQPQAPSQWLSPISPSRTRDTSDADVSSDFSSLSEMDPLQLQQQQQHQQQQQQQRQRVYHHRDLVGSSSGDYSSDYETQLGGRWDLTAHWHLGDYSEGVEGDNDDDEDDDDADMERDNDDTDVSESSSNPRPLPVSSLSGQRPNQLTGSTSSSISNTRLDLDRVQEILDSSPSSTPIVLSALSPMTDRSGADDGTVDPRSSENEDIGVSRPLSLSTVSSTPSSATATAVALSINSLERSVGFSSREQQRTPSSTTNDTPSDDVRTLVSEEGSVRADDDDFSLDARNAGVDSNRDSLSIHDNVDTLGRQQLTTTASSLASSASTDRVVSPLISVDFENHLRLHSLRSVDSSRWSTSRPLTGVVAGSGSYTPRMNIFHPQHSSGLAREDHHRPPHSHGYGYTPQHLSHSTTMPLRIQQQSTQISSSTSSPPPPPPPPPSIRNHMSPYWATAGRYQQYALAASPLSSLSSSPTSSMASSRMASPIIDSPNPIFVDGKALESIVMAGNLEQGSGSMEPEQTGAESREGQGVTSMRSTATESGMASTSITTAPAVLAASAIAAAATHRQVASSHIVSLPSFVSHTFTPRIQGGSMGPAGGVYKALKANHPRRQCCFLQAGQKFNGTQNLKKQLATLSGVRSRQIEEWDVKVTINAVDYDAGVVYGLMEAVDVPMSASNVVTFWEGEIVDFENYTFWTKKWAAKPRTDLEHWKRLEAFQGMDEKHIIKGGRTGRFRGQVNKKYIFMRWKEKHFVNMSEHMSGLTIAGFYYVSMRRSDGYVEGYYHDQQSSPFQHLSLNPVFETAGFSSSIFEVA